MSTYQLGLTAESPCPYRAGETEQLAILMGSNSDLFPLYESWLGMGFRRSGDRIYRPHCPNCHSCQSLRIHCPTFTPSRSQKRQLAQLTGLEWVFKTTLDDNWFELYSDYICQRHSTGGMYPPQKNSFLSFIENAQSPPLYLHLYEQNKLIAIAVTDTTSEAFSAMYTFFDPNHTRSLGTLCVLIQIKEAQKQNKTWLYPGFYIKESPAMNYKIRFHPHQRYIDQEWTN